jgi:uncharacterized membrane protein YuzA (DUF378 family)
MEETKMDLNNKVLYDVSEWLLIIGGLNWALVEFGDMNLVSYLGDSLGMVVYALVGLSAIYQIWHKLK